MKIIDIASVNPKINLKKASYINYIDTSSVYDGKLISVQYLNTNYPSRAKRIIQINDILISSVRPNLKHNYFVKIDLSNLFASTGFIHVRCNTSYVIPQYLYYFLTNEKMVAEYTNIAHSSQTTFPCFNKAVIENIEIDLPSLQKQQHIVDTIPILVLISLILLLLTLYSLQST